MRCVYQYHYEDDGRLVFRHVTPSISEILGVEAETLLLEPGLIETLIHPDDLPLVHTSLQQANASRTVRHLRYRYCQPCGGIRWVEVRATPMVTPDGALFWNGVMSVVEEDSHTSGYEISGQHSLFAQPGLNNALHMCWQRSEKGCLSWLSPAGFVFFGEESAAKDLNQLWLDRVHPEDQKMYSQTYANLPSAPWRLEYRLLHHDQTWHWVMDQGNPVFGSDQHLQGFIGSCLDIDRYKALETSLGRADDFYRFMLLREEQLLADERRQIAQHLHDDLGQYLAAMDMNLYVLRNTHSAEEEHAHKLQQLSELLEEGRKSLRRVTSLVGSPFALDGGLGVAVEHLVQRLGDTGKHQIRLDTRACDCLAGSLGDEESLTVYRFVQEGLTNAMRHGKAENINVFLACGYGVVTAEVRDDGVGFDPALVKRSGGFGLDGMRERIRAVNGSFSISTTPGKGCVLTLHLQKMGRCANCQVGARA